jgi:cellobiose phosphorylase
VCKGVKSITVDGQAVTGNIIPYLKDRQTQRVVVVMGN